MNLRHINNASGSRVSLFESKADQERLFNWLSDGYGSNKSQDELRGICDYFLKFRNAIKAPKNDLYWWIKNGKPGDFYWFIIGMQDDALRKKEAERKASDGAVLLHSDEDWKVYEIKSYEASAKYGKNTRWCITGSKRWDNGENGERYFDRYKNSGIRFFFFIKADGEKYALTLYPDNKTIEIFDAADNSISYIPGAPEIDEIPVNYTSKDPARIIYNAFIADRIPRSVSLDIVASTVDYAVNRGGDGGYCEIYDSPKGFTRFLDNNVPDGYVEHEAVALDRLTKEEYAEITGEDYDRFWGGDIPNFDVYEIGNFKTKADLCDESHYRKYAFILVLNNSEDNIITFLTARDWGDLLLKISTEFGSAFDSGDYWSSGSGHDYGGAKASAFIDMCVTSFVERVENGFIPESVLKQLDLTKEQVLSINESFKQKESYDTLTEATEVPSVSLYTCGYITPEGKILELDEYHGEEKSLRDLKYVEYSNTHWEEDTCVRIYQEPTQAQYAKLEDVIDLYLNDVGYCKVEIWKDFRKYTYYKAFSLYDGACGDPHTDEIVGNWTGYKLTRIIKEYFGNKISEAINSSKHSLEKQLDGYTYGEALQIIKSQIIEILNWNDLDVEITGLDFTGSRRFGDPREDSDLDMRMTYEGDEREDTVFNVLHDDDNPVRLGDFVIDINPIRDGDIDSLIDADSRYKKESLSEEADSKILYHGSSSLFDKFNKKINWLTDNIEYAKEFAHFAADVSYIYECKQKASNILDIGNTGVPCYQLFPTKPYRLSKELTVLCSKLGVPEDDIRPILDAVASDYDEPYDGFKMKLHVLTRSVQFRDLVMSKGYEGIKCIEQGHNTWGIFNPDDIEIIKVNKLDESLSEGYPMPKKLYSIKDKKATWDDDAQDYIWWDSEAKHNDKYATCYKAKLSPKDFLDLTTSKGAANLKIGDELGFGKLKELDIDEFNKETYQPCFLIISFENEHGTIRRHDFGRKEFEAEVVGHEGRHRMFALMQAGIDEVDVQIKITGKYYDKYAPYEINKLNLIGQFNKAAKVTINNPTAMSFETHRQINPKLNDNLKEDTNIPKKIGIAYKVFRVKNGKLYPPMVANQNNEDTPIGVWLDAQEGEFAGLSKTGRSQVKSLGGGVLSYRPGWHLGDVPRAQQFDRRNKETGEMEFPKDFVWAECEYTMDIDYQKDSDEQGYMRTKRDDNGNIITYRSDKYQHSLAGLPRLPKNGYYRYRTNPNPDTVPWVITGKMKVNKLLGDDEVNEILVSKGIEPIHRQGGDKTLEELGLTNIDENLNEDVSLAGTSIEYFDKLTIDNSLKDNYNITEGIGMDKYYWIVEPEKNYRNKYSGTWKTRVPKNGFKVNRYNYKEILDDPDAIAAVEEYFDSHVKSYQCIVTYYQKEINNSDLNENIEKHDELNPKLWNENHTLKEEVKYKINQIVDQFLDALKEDGIKIKVKDIRLVGSNCSYNYNDQSDLDIHIIADTDGLECPEKHLSKLYSAYRSIFNKNFDIDFYGIPVEIYVEVE